MAIGKRLELKRGRCASPEKERVTYTKGPCSIVSRSHCSFLALFLGPLLLDPQSSSFKRKVHASCFYHLSEQKSFSYELV